MLKKLFYACLVLTALASCKKETETSTDNSSVTASTKKKSGFSTLTYYYTTDPRPQGLYLDADFLDILGNTLKEDSLITWCIAHEINKLSYYQMRTILPTSRKNQLSLWIKKAKGNGIKDHVAIMASASTFTYIKNYNVAQLDTSKFTSIQIEDEWWGSSKSVTDYNNAVTLMKSMKVWGQAQTPKIKCDLYFGRFNNVPGTNAQAADTLVKYSDRVLIANEMSDPVTNYYPSYLQTRVTEFYDAAGRASVWYPLSIIFYPGQAPTYFGSTSYHSAFTTFTGRAWDAYVRSDDKVHGYQLFALANVY